MTNRLWVRLTLMSLLIHAALLPPLYFGLMLIIRRSHTDAFVDQVRAHARVLADEFELGDARESPRRTRELLDSVILSGQGVYAELVDGQQAVRSALLPPNTGEFPGDDFAFGYRGDGTYYLSQPVALGADPAMLRLGFDESGTLEDIARARHRVVLALLAFTATSLALVIFLAMRAARTMAHLQTAASRIAGGHYEERLRSGSTTYEVLELEDHLDSMRSELVGINARLSREMAERAAADAQRRSLEDRLRHRERVATVGTLAGGIAHEFNNILTPILLYSETALEELPPDHASSEDLKRVITSAHRARALINRILTFSREIEVGPPGLVTVGPVVDEVVALLQDIVPADVEIFAEVVGMIPPILGEQRLLHQLTMNLCTNAYQSMRAAGGRIRIELSHRREDADDRVPPGDYVVLSVADTGHGMDAATMNRIFEPFFTTREVGEGTGLGLSVAHGIASAINATIVVDSELGKGSEFRVYFPVPAEATSAAPGKESNNGVSAGN